MPVASQRFLNINAVVDRTALAKRTIYEMLQAGRFPRPVQLTRARVGWVESEIDDWMTAKIVERDQGAAA